jgi:HEAT repeat protein
MTFLFAGALLLSGAGNAAVDVPASATLVEESFKSLATYEFGADNKPLLAIEDRVRNSFADPGRKSALAGRLAGMLGPGTTEEGRRFILRQLALIGGPAEVPPIAPLLADPKLSDLARFALEPIPGPVAGNALTAGLGKLSGNMLLGTIASVGRRQETGAVETLIGFLGRTDPALVQTAAGALGAICGDRAFSALISARKRVGLESRPAVTYACLKCAMTGRKETAAGVYRDLYKPGEPGAVRAAALLGLVELKGPTSFPQVLEGLADSDPEVWNAALRALRIVPLTGRTTALQAGFRKLAPGEQALVLGALAARSDSAGRSLAGAAVRSADAGVREAAFRALASFGGVQEVPLLAGAAARETGDVRKAAREGLDRLSGPGVNAAIVALARQGKPAVRIEAIRSLAERGTESAIPDLEKLARNPDHGIRLAALAGLGEMARARSLDFLLSCALSAPDAEIREEAVKSAESVCKWAKREACEGPVLAACAKATPDVRPALIAILPTVGGEKALAFVRDNLSGHGPEAGEAALRALGDWPEASPAIDMKGLLDTARNAPDMKLRVLALRGYIRLAGLPAKRSDAETVAMLGDALAAAPRPEDARPVLSALAKLANPASLALAVKYLDDKDLGTEAASAVVEIAPKVRAADPDAALEALVRAEGAAGDDETRKKAQEAIKDFDGHGDYLTAWTISGPYQKKGVTDEGLLDEVFPPELADRKDVEWNKANLNPESGKPWQVDVVYTTGGGDHRVAYLRTTVDSPRKLKATMELGSDDGIKVWINGKIVHAKNAFRPVEDGEDRVPVKLDKGPNVVLVKLTQLNGEWGLSLRFRTMKGDRIRGLKVAP